MISCLTGRVEAQPHDRHTSLWVHLAQHRPRAMVKSPGLVGLYNGPPDQFQYSISEFRRTRGGVLLLEQSWWEAVEIMDGARRLHRSDLRAVGFPMGGDAQDGFGRRDLPGSLLPGAVEFIVFDGIHRAAMPDKQCRHD